MESNRLYFSYVQDSGQQAKRGASKFKTVVTIFRKVVNSFKIIALIENRYIVYMNIRQHV